MISWSFLNNLTADYRYKVQIIIGGRHERYSGTHQNLGYRCVPGTEKISEVGHRWVPSTDEIAKDG